MGKEKEQAGLIEMVTRNCFMREWQQFSTKSAKRPNAFWMSFDELIRSKKLGHLEHLSPDKRVGQGLISLTSNK